MTPIGNIWNEADLRRFIEQEMLRPGVLPTPQPPIVLVKNGAPEDGDFPYTPGNGIFAYDREAGVLYARIDDEWQAV